MSPQLELTIYPFRGRETYVVGPARYVRNLAKIKTVERFYFLPHYDEVDQP